MERTKLSEVVSNFLDATDLGEAEYSKAYRIALRGAREFQFDLDGNIQIEELCLNGDYTVDLPANSIKILRVGVLRNNSIEGLTTNHNIKGSMCFDWESSDGRLSTGRWVDKGEYRIVDGKLLLHPNTPCDTIVIEHTVLYQEGEEHFVHPLAQEALISYIRYQWFLTRKNKNGWDKQFFKKQFEDDLSKARFRIKAPTIDQYRQHAYSTTGVKRYK